MLCKILVLSAENSFLCRYNEGSYCCKVEVRTGVPDEDAASIMSNYVAVDESHVRLNLKSEIETQFDLIESVSKEDTLKI